MGTTANGFRQSAEFQQGRTAEKLIAELLKSKGWMVLPSYDYTGEDQNKAPRLQGLSFSWVIPDLDVCQNGVRRWVEVKSKTKPDWTRITKRLEHGIHLRHYKSYLAVQKETGCQVWLCVFEENTRLALIQSIDELTKTSRIYDGDKMAKGGMIFFPRDSFKPFASLD